MNGPNGSGRFDLSSDLPNGDLLRKLAAKAQHLLVVGTCAALGGVGNIGPIEASGLMTVR